MILTILTVSAFLNGRAFYIDQPNALIEINKSVAAAMSLPILPVPEINLVDQDPDSPFGAVRIDKAGKITVTLTKRAKLYHTYHEMVHYYQYSYKLVGNLSCKKPKEIDAMTLAAKWCETNNCPSKPIAELKKIAGCK